MAGEVSKQRPGHRGRRGRLRVVEDRLALGGALGAADRQRGLGRHRVGVPVLYGVRPVAPVEDFAQVAGKMLATTVEEVLGPDPTVEVRESVEPGHQVLLDAAAHAQLLVVGSRGHGGFASALLGSVSQYCTHHAHCPVVIIRGKS